MRRITFDSPHRRKHFEFFRAMAQPHTSVCAPLPVAPLLAWVRERGRPLHATMVYAVSDAANRVPELRWRIRGEEVVEHDLVHPSFTVATDEADVFSFCEVKYGPRYDRFIEAAEAAIARMRDAPSLEDEPGRDDYLFLSSFPWVAFSAVTHASHCPAADSVPRIVWGRYGPPAGQPDGPVTIPVSIQAHHALVDGRHLGRFFELLQRTLADPASAFGR